MRKKIKLPVRENRFLIPIKFYYIVVINYGDIQEIQSFSSNFHCKLDPRVKRVENAKKPVKIILMQKCLVS